MPRRRHRNQRRKKRKQVFRPKHKRKNKTSHKSRVDTMNYTKGTPKTPKLSTSLASTETCCSSFVDNSQIDDIINDNVNQTPKSYLMFTPKNSLICRPRSQSCVPKVSTGIFSYQKTPGKRVRNSSPATPTKGHISLRTRTFSSSSSLSPQSPLAKRSKSSAPDNRYSENAHVPATHLPPTTPRLIHKQMLCSTPTSTTTTGLKPRPNQKKILLSPIAIGSQKTTVDEHHRQLPSFESWLVSIPKPLTCRVIDYLISVLKKGLAVFYRNFIKIFISRKAGCKNASVISKKTVGTMTSFVETARKVRMQQQQAYHSDRCTCNDRLAIFDKQWTSRMAMMQSEIDFLKHQIMTSAGKSSSLVMGMASTSITSFQPPQPPPPPPPPPPPLPPPQYLHTSTMNRVFKTGVRKFNSANKALDDVNNSRPNITLDDILNVKLRKTKSTVGRSVSNQSEALIDLGKIKLRPTIQRPLVNSFNTPTLSNDDNNNSTLPSVVDSSSNSLWEILERGESNFQTARRLRPRYRHLKRSSSSTSPTPIERRLSSPFPSSAAPGTSMSTPSAKVLIQNKLTATATVSVNQTELNSLATPSVSAVTPYVFTSGCSRQIANTSNL